MPKKFTVSVILFPCPIFFVFFFFVLCHALAGGPSDSRVLSSVHTLGLHSYYVPTFCDACSQLLVGIMQQGLQ